MWLSQSFKMVYTDPKVAVTMNAEENARREYDARLFTVGHQIGTL